MKLKRFNGVCVLFALVLITLAGPAARAADADTNYDGPTWAFEDAKKFLATASDITTAKYPDSDSATVEKNLVRVYHVDGTAKCQDESFVKILTEKGRRENRTLTLGFMLPYQTVSVPLLEIYKADGSVVPVDVAANSKEAIDESQMSMNISDPNSKVLQVNIPRVDIGDVIHAVTRTTVERPYIPGQYAEENVFEDNGYIRHIAYQIYAPAGRPLQQIALRDPVPGTVQYSVSTNSDGTVLHHWEVNDVPRMFEEPSMPSYDEVLQRLLVSTMPSWLDVSKWYWQLSASHLAATTPAMTNLVTKLAATGTDIDKIKALFYYVSKKVRYMGLTPEKDRPGFEPHDVCLTFDKNYGVCRDKAALLVSLLRTAGFNAYPVLINVGAKRDPQVPDCDFDHAIVCVELVKGKYLLMDPTDENTRDLLPYYDCNLSYLVCRPEGEQLLISPVQPPENHMMRIATTGTLDVNGSLEARSVLSFEGVNDDAYRNAFVQMKPDDKQRFFETNLKRTLPGARLKSLKLLPENMLDMSSNVCAELEFSATGLTATGNGKAIVSLPWIGGHLGVVNFILRGAGLEKRKYPLQTATTCGLDESLSLKLGPGFGDAVALPVCTPDEDDNMSWQEQFACQNGMLTGSRVLKLKVVEFSPPAYAKLKATLKAMEYDGRKSPILAVTAQESAAPLAASLPANAAVSSDAKILDVQKDLTVIDAHTSVYRVKYSKQILSYNGKKREAELKIGYNPACQDVHLVEGVVTSKDGKRESISPGEINAMDAGWNASAKRYTGGKILVANLPDVEIGSTIEVEYVVTNHDRPYLSGYESFQLPDEVAAKTFTFTAPDNLPVRQSESGTTGVIQETKTKANGNTTSVWSVKDIPALPAESETPPEWLWASGVSYFIGDADDYYRQLNRTLLDRSAQGTNAAAMAHQLVSAAKTPAEQVRAIRDFVVESIRQAGPSFTDLPLSELSAADTTLADGYGHQADCAILLHAMLTAAGFHPEFVLASELPKIKSITDFTKSFPLPGEFQSLLVRVKVADQTYYLNDTDQYAQLGTTPHDGQMAMALSSGAREWVKAVKNAADRTETDYEISLTDQGGVQVEVDTHFYGTDFNSKKQYFTELPPEERRRYFQELVSGFAQGAHPVGDLVTDFSTYPGLEKYTVQVDNYAVVDGNYLYFDLPFYPSLFSVGSDSRALPLYATDTGDDLTRAEITLPPSFSQVVMAPKSEKLHAPGGTARITSTGTPGKYVITEDCQTVPAIITPADYAATLQVESKLRQRSSRVFVLEKE